MVPTLIQTGTADTTTRVQDARTFTTNVHATNVPCPPGSPGSPGIPAAPSVPGVPAAPGVRCDLIEYPNATHGFFNQNPHYTITTRAILTFLHSLSWLPTPH